MKKYISRRTGFTLIELLVVVAIIGILAAVVIAALSDSRDRSKDAAVKTSMGSLRNFAEDYYVSTYDFPNVGPNSYGSDGSTIYPAGNLVPSGSPPFNGLCLYSQTTTILKEVAKSTGNNVVCQGGTNGASYIIYTALRKPTSGMTFCMDNSGTFAEVPTDDMITSGNVKCK